jgi:hypothetical protein
MVDERRDCRLVSADEERSADEDASQQREPGIFSPG